MIPPVTQGLVAHIDPANLSATDGQAVTSAPAVGGPTAWTVQGTGPIYRASGVKGRPYLEHSSSGTGLRWAQNISAGDSTIFVVARKQSVNGRILSGLSNNWLLGWHSNGEDKHYALGWVHNPATLTTTDLISYSARRTSGVNSFRRWGNLLAENTIGKAGPNGLTTNGHQGGGEFSDSDVYEVIAYDRALTDAEVQQTFDYFAFRYLASQATYSDAILADGPVGYWRLRETSGTVAVAEEGPDATYVGAPIFGVAGALAGDGDTAVHVDEASWVQVDEATNPAPIGAAPRSMFLWVRNVDDGSIANGGRFLAYGVSQTSQKLHIRREGANLRIEWAGGYIVGAAGDWAAWQHVGFTYDGTTIRGYVDGVQVSSRAVTLNTAPSPLYYGHDPHHGTTTICDIDEPVIYDRVLTAAEVAEHYRIGSTGRADVTYDTLTGWYLTYADVDTQYPTYNAIPTVVQDAISSVIGAGSTQTEGVTGRGSISSTTTLASTQTEGVAERGSASDVTASTSTQTAGVVERHGSSDVAAAGGAQTAVRSERHGSSDVAAAGSTQVIAITSRSDSSHVTGGGVVVTIAQHSTTHTSDVAARGNTQTSGRKDATGSASITTAPRLTTSSHKRVYAKTDIVGLGDVDAAGRKTSVVDSGVSAAGNVNDTSQGEHHWQTSVSGAGRVSTFTRFTVFSTSEVTVGPRTEAIGARTTFSDSEVTTVTHLQTESARETIAESTITQQTRVRTSTLRIQKHGSDISAGGNDLTLYAVERGSSSSLSGSPRVETQARQVLDRTSSLTGAGSTGATGQFIALGLSDVSGSGGTSPDGEAIRASSSLITDRPDLTTYVAVSRAVVSDVIGTGTISTATDFAAFVQSFVSGAGSTAAVAVAIREGSSSTSTTGTISTSSISIRNGMSSVSQDGTVASASSITHTTSSSITTAGTVRTDGRPADFATRSSTVTGTGTVDTVLHFIAPGTSFVTGGARTTTAPGEKTGLTASSAVAGTNVDTGILHIAIINPSHVSGRVLLRTVGIADLARMSSMSGVGTLSSFYETLRRSDSGSSAAGHVDTEFFSMLGRWVDYAARVRGYGYVRSTYWLSRAKGLYAGDLRLWYEANFHIPTYIRLLQERGDLRPDTHDDPITERGPQDRYIAPDPPMPSNLWEASGYDPARYVQLVRDYGTIEKWYESHRSNA